MSQTLPLLTPHSLAFPSVELALTDPNGLLAFGGDLSIARLIAAYKKGIFPWFSDGDPIMWWSPQPRAIIPTDSIHISRSLKKFINKEKYTVSINRCFNDVIDQCANAPFRSDETWIVADMLQAYKNLHLHGHAHSIEVWQQDQLVGGLYGVAINGFFSGESMFYQADNASKIALIALAEHLKSANINFIDCQIINPFLADMGCIEITRNQFVSYKELALSVSLPQNFWRAKQIYARNHL